MMIIRENDAVYVAYSPIREQTYFKEVYFDVMDFADEDNAWIWKVPGAENCIMAGIRNSREIDVLKYCTNLLDGVEGELDIVQVKTKVLPAIKQALVDAGELDNVTKVLKNNYYIAQNNKAFSIGRAGNVMEVEDYDRDGAVTNLAISCMEKHKDMPAGQRFAKTAEFLEQKDGALIFPLVMMDTKNQKLSLINRPQGDQK